MDLVDKSFLRWQMIHQPRRFRESLAAARDQLVCALSRHERTATLEPAPGESQAPRKDARS